MLNTNKKIIMGRFAKPHGVCGFVKVVSFFNPIEALLNYKIWQIQHQNRWKMLTMQSGKVYGPFLIVKLKGVENPETVKYYTNNLIAIERETLPPLEEGEYYWSDLIGLRVISVNGLNLGTIVSLIETISNDVLIVKNKDREQMIPYISQVVRSVNIEANNIVVDWEVDF
ncbi:ribosome maturation factor RimM [Coxiella endosymbiont of Amblyomma nuttalli]|uniref:ribosome maturation factor RimM n=1 Tax=Coxiella endosymbiont of Amblyomma nuttalli TaxID=2749996 RepID=UPI001BAC91BA|nr:ribosome maturation factor RimM [Coxiella endosymbiont of Amblyomma nuttalli]QTS83992.1 Ribosome maturation factor RimM [Coxiella endosymbiont of Amblyomma nuttalli]